MIFMFPTFFYVVSAAVRIMIRSENRYLGLKGRENRLYRRNFVFTLLSDALILNVVNGFTIIFGMTQILFGISTILVGTLISLFGISSIFTETEDVRELFLVIANIVIFGEFLDFLLNSSIVSGSVIIALIALFLYYAIRMSGVFEPQSPQSS